LIIPDRACVSVVTDNTKTDVFVVTNQAGIGLIDPAKILDKIFAGHDSAFINYYQGLAVESDLGI